MSGQVPASPGADGSAPVPRDPPDQQADGAPDPWEAARSEPSAADADDGADTDVPDTDEAGTGRRGSARETGAPSQDPAPEEPSG
ncbi:hypothetical protein ABZV77_41980 [Streptomyces sp. NPDC004732]|uniref:hypothetical protein n=1 Tax=Streptomyces sp. NPDC004732 TaxID=3154290 RepID=UPI0033BE44A7